MAFIEGAWAELSWGTAVLRQCVWGAFGAFAMHSKMEFWIDLMYYL